MFNQVFYPYGTVGGSLTLLERTPFIFTICGTITVRLKRFHIYNNKLAHITWVSRSYFSILGFIITKILTWINIICILSSLTLCCSIIVLIFM